MKIRKDLKIVVIDSSVPEASRLMVLLNPLSRNLTICSSYSQGLLVIQDAVNTNTPFDLVFLALPPEHHPEINTILNVLALKQNPESHCTVVLGEKNYLSSFSQDLGDSVMLSRPITREKLQQALEPLGISLPCLNCWEYMQCERELGGRRVAELGVCPVSENKTVDGLHKGKCGGRACWAIGGTLCGGKVQGSFASKIKNCMECDFYNMVKTEEGDCFSSIDSILNRLRMNRDKGGI